MTPTLRIIRTEQDLPLPTYRHPGDSGLDLYAVEDVLLPVATRARVRTGIRLGIPDGYEAQVRPRSGHSLEGLDVAIGTIDAGYRGEVQAVIINATGKPRHIPRGTRIAQLVVAPVARCAVVEVADLDETERGAGGFGSTGAGPLCRDCGSTVLATGCHCVPPAMGPWRTR